MRVRQMENKIKIPIVIHGQPVLSKPNQSPCAKTIKQPIAQRQNKTAMMEYSNRPPLIILKSLRMQTTVVSTKAANPATNQSVSPQFLPSSTIQIMKKAL